MYFLKTHCSFTPRALLACYFIFLISLSLCFTELMGAWAIVTLTLKNPCDSYNDHRVMGLWVFELQKSLHLFACARCSATNWQQSSPLGESTQVTLLPSLNLACCTSPICPGQRNQTMLLPLVIPNWNNPANESLEVSFQGLCNVSAGAEFVYTLPVSSFTNFKKHIDKFPSCFGSASINHPTNSTNISPGLL